MRGGGGAVRLLDLVTGRNSEKTSQLNVFVRKKNSFYNWVMVYAIYIYAISDLHLKPLSEAAFNSTTILKQCFALYELVMWQSPSTFQWILHTRKRFYLYNGMSSNTKKSNMNNAGIFKSVMNATQCSHVELLNVHFLVFWFCLLVLSSARGGEGEGGKDGGRRRRGRETGEMLVIFTREPYRLSVQLDLVIWPIITDSSDPHCWRLSSNGHNLLHERWCWNKIFKLQIQMKIEIRGASKKMAKVGKCQFFYTQ